MCDFQKANNMSIYLPTNEKYEKNTIIFNHFDFAAVP